MSSNQNLDRSFCVEKKRTLPTKTNLSVIAERSTEDITLPSVRQDQLTDYFAVAALADAEEGPPLPIEL